MKPNASTKSVNRYSRCSLPSCTVQPASAVSRWATSPPSSLVVAMAGLSREHRATVTLLLVDPAELAGDGTATLADRRARHLREVLGAEVGSRVRAGIVGGGVGSAELVADD